MIPLIEFFKEIERETALNTNKFQPPIVYCKLFEDNSAAMEIARVPKMRLDQNTSTKPPFPVLACSRQTFQ